MMRTTAIVWNYFANLILIADALEVVCRAKVEDFNIVSRLDASRVTRIEEDCKKYCCCEDRARGESAVSSHSLRCNGTRLQIESKRTKGY